MIKTLYDPVVEEEGRKKGKEEGRKEVALAAIKEGLNLDLISKITGLDKKTIHELKEEERPDH